MLAAPPASGVAGDTPEAEALVVSHLFDPGKTGDPYRAVVRVSGSRVLEGVRPEPADFFTHEEVVDPVVPGSGPVSVTSPIYGLRPGRWNVSAELIRPGAPEARPSSHGRAVSLAAARWSWPGWTVEPREDEPVPTRWALTAPLARIPGVIPGSYPALFVAAVIVALGTQALLLDAAQMSMRSLLVSLLALAAGLVAAKVWSVLLHPGESFLKGGWAVDGFLVVAPVVAIASMIALGLPVGPYLDVTTPGLFFAVAIGRVGCFLTGCCAGHATASRWGLWSSDRRVGARRVPTQLIESAIGLFVGLLTLPIVVIHVHAIHGAVFVPALAVYLVARQALLRLRAEPRSYSWQRSHIASAHS